MTQQPCDAGMHKINTLIDSLTISAIPRRGVAKCIEFNGLATSFLVSVRFHSRHAADLRNRFVEQLDIYVGRNAALNSSVIYFVAIVLFVSTGLVANEDSAGPAIGSKIEPFQLQDQTNTSRKLSDFLNAGPIAVVFHRSADW